jgi:transposase-like protein
MKGNKFYSDSFKKQVVYEVRSGFLSKEEARRKYGIKGSNAVLE